VQARTGPRSGGGTGVPASEVYQTRARPLCTALDGPRAQQDALVLAGRLIGTGGFP